jgi:hypothetical protein
VKPNCKAKVPTFEQCDRRKSVASGVQLTSVAGTALGRKGERRSVRSIELQGGARRAR